MDADRQLIQVRLQRLANLRKAALALVLLQFRESVGEHLARSQALHPQKRGGQAQHRQRDPEAPAQLASSALVQKSHCIFSAGRPRSRVNQGHTRRQNGLRNVPTSALELNRMRVS